MEQVAMERYQFNLPPLYFLHIPKTAGTSLKHWLYEFYCEDQVLGIQVPDELSRVSRQEINDARLITGHFGWQLLDYFDQPRLAITWLRDPVKRAISNFRYTREQLPMLISEAKKVGRDDWIEFYEHCSRLSFDELIDQQMYEGFVDNMHTRHLANFFPGNEPLFIDGQVLALAKQNLEKLSFVGFSEWMAPSISLCSYQLGFPYYPLTHKLNTTSQTEPKGAPLISEEGKQRLESIERFDRQLYDWAKTRFHHQLARFLEQVKATDKEQESPVDARSVSRSFTEVIHDFSIPELQDRIRKVVNQNFQASQANPLVDAGELCFADLVVQEGWHPRWLHRESGATIRWSGPSNSSKVQVPLKPGSDYEVVFLVYNHAGRQFIEKMSIFANDVPVPSKVKFIDDMPYKAIVWFLVPRRAIKRDQLTDVTIVVPDELKPANFGNHPKLSFATDGFKFRASAKDCFSIPFWIKNVEFIVSNVPVKLSPVDACLPLPPSILNAVNSPSITTTHEVCNS
jgi:hypothetical protein